MGVSPLASATNSSREPEGNGLTLPLPIRSKSSVTDLSHSRRPHPLGSVEPVNPHESRLNSFLLPAVATARLPIAPDLTCSPRRHISDLSRPLNAAADDDDDDNKGGQEGEDDDDADQGGSLASAPCSLTSTPALSASPDGAVEFSGGKSFALAERRGLALLRSSRPAMDPGSLAGATPFSPDQAHSFPTWLEPAMNAAMRVVQQQEPHNSSMKILSQALPLPLTPGHQFSLIVQTARMQCEPTKVMFVNMMHAVPGRYKMSELPRTPPATPGPAIGGDNYFTAKVFDSAVTAMDYQNELVHARSTEFALAAPGSLELCIIERYIPPSTVPEVAGLFGLYGHSLLVDRLIEVSPNNGCAMFVYPTKKGGETFKQDYLGPSLDPTLRSMSSMYDLTEDFATSIDTFKALDHLPDYKSMVINLERLVQDLNAGVPAAKLRLRQQTAHFEVIYSGKQEVALDDKVWVDWWTKQEKQRIREAVSSYFGASRALPKLDTNRPEVQQSALVQELLEAVGTRAARNKPQRKLEVGVFVIQRTQVQQ